MSIRVNRKPVAVAIGAALISSIAVAGVAQASAYAVSALGTGYMLAAGEPQATPATPATPAAPADEKAKEGKCGEGKCGEGKCGADKKAEGKCGEGKCGEGKCGADKKPAEEKPEA
jgi:uncharacterized low-complexity protein